jgi:alpha-glucosidase (family GH31 glycosyl hydrolase)
MQSLAQKAAREHHALIPYTRSFMYQAVQTGMPVMRAMIFVDPNDSSLHDKWDEYLYGSEILVAPVTDAGTSRSVYFPQGKWIDYNDKRTVKTGPGTSTVSAPLDTIPVYVREGAIIPRGDVLRANNNWTPNWTPYVDIEFFPQAGVSNTFPYYTGGVVIPIACATTAEGTATIEFSALDYNGNLKVYCNGYTSITRNDIPLIEDVDYTWEGGSGERGQLTIPYTGATRVVITESNDIK